MPLNAEHKLTVEKFNNKVRANKDVRQGLTDERDRQCMELIDNIKDDKIDLGYQGVFTRFFINNKVREKIAVGEFNNGFFLETRVRLEGSDDAKKQREITEAKDLVMVKSAMLAAFIFGAIFCAIGVVIPDLFTSMDLVDKVGLGVASAIGGILVGGVVGATEASSVTSNDRKGISQVAKKMGKAFGQEKLGDMIMQEQEEEETKVEQERGGGPDLGAMQKMLAAQAAAGKSGGRGSS